MLQTLFVSLPWQFGGFSDTSLAERICGARAQIIVLAGVAVDWSIDYPKPASLLILHEANHPLFTPSCSCNNFSVECSENRCGQCVRCRWLCMQHIHRIIPAKWQIFICMCREFRQKFSGDFDVIMYGLPINICILYAYDCNADDIVTYIYIYIWNIIIKKSFLDSNFTAY